ncbi:MAG: acyltransferase domain-containing protein [bacterium]|nr:acyltransferase domain-containing protein [bacterium]
MGAVLAEEEQVKAALTGYEDRVSIAAINSSHNVVISGETGAVNEILSALRDEGIETRSLRASHAFHSPLMEPVLEEFRSIAEEVSYAAPKLNFVSTLSGKFAEQELTDPNYWSRHIRQTVRFYDAIETLERHGYGIFVEIGADSTLSSLGKRSVSTLASLFLPSLKRKQPDWKQILSCVGRLYVSGVNINWKFACGLFFSIVTIPIYAQSLVSIYVLNKPEAASGFGHNAILIPAGGKYKFFSKYGKSPITGTDRNTNTVWCLGRFIARRHGALWAIERKRYQSSRYNNLLTELTCVLTSANERSNLL